jgi:SAM-dependent methyltransferase
MNDCFEHVAGLLRHYRSATVNETMSPTETMNGQEYWRIGQGAIEVIALACASARIRDVRRVLDLPCGHGRVLRHLVHLFPGAEYHACDLDRPGVDFCSSTFGAVPIYSNEDLTTVEFPCNYDVIWIGSLFTHTSREVTRRMMEYLVRWLSPQGIIVATLHGRWSEHVHNLFPMCPEARWQEILVEYDQSGYGYRNLPRELSHDYIEGDYGISLTKPHAILEDIEDIPGVRIHLYRERGWEDNHDVVAFGRPSYDEPWPGGMTIRKRIHSRNSPFSNQFNTSRFRDAARSVLKRVLKRA